MTKPRGQPRTLPMVLCPKCGEEIGSSYLARHLKREHHA
jgi:ribosomal protein S27AE